MAAQQTRLEDQARQLQDADRRKDAFLATLAHELRNPLAPIRNAAEVLRSRDVAPETAENARAMIERQVVVMARLLEDLLDVSRISRGEFHLRKEFVLLKDVVARAVEQSRPVLEANRLELSIALPAEPIHLEADPTRLAQVFANLLNNAAKYSEPGARATLTAQLRDGHVWVSVLDTGIGIAPESLPRLFEMFSQLAPMLERSRDGLGVGLSLAQALVEGHGGSIEARSDGLGRGSEFVVRLPVSERPAAPATPAAPERRAADPHRVLVVDDNRDAADSMSLILQFDGHDVRTAYDGEEALQVAETFRPRVVLLDIGLPLMNGYEVARALRALPWGKDVMLVAITGWGQDEDRRQALEAGFDRHLTKPVDPGAVTTLLAERSTSAAGARP